jgi:hypothetical protein
LAQSPDSSFEVFLAPEYGVRAMIKLLTGYIKEGNNTISKIISKYAPRNENNTDSYIQRVSKTIGVRKNRKLKPTKDTLRLLVLSMSKFENGGNYVTNALFEQAYAMI